jgi:hypothetical protein
MAACLVNFRVTLVVVHSAITNSLRWMLYVSNYTLVLRRQQARSFFRCLSNYTDVSYLNELILSIKQIRVNRPDLILLKGPQPGRPGWLHSTIWPHISSQGQI